MRDRRRQRRMREILDSALALIAADGVGALTMHRLAERLDYTPGALYRYFPAKEALLAELERRAVSGLALAIERAWKRLAGPKRHAPLVRLLAAARIYASLPEVAPEAAALLAQTTADARPLVPDAEYARVLAVLRPLFAALERELALAARAGALDSGPAAERAVVLFAAVHGSVAARKLARLGPRFDVGDVTLRHVGALFRGWGATAAVVRGALRELAAVERQSALLLPNMMEMAS